jgi:transcriptional regulator with XRE-family HTH domain
MDIKNVVKGMGNKLRKLRESLRLRYFEMAGRLDINRATYTRYEDGTTPPGIKTLCKLGLEYGFSLDWFILNRGPQYYEAVEKKLALASKKEPTLLDRMPADVIDLLEYMEQVPSFRYEVLLFFHGYRTEHGEKEGAVTKGNEG